jgi:hypothetical protein
MIEHIAYHEAGHAVIAFRLGYEVKKVTIKPNYRRRALGNAKVTHRGWSPDVIRIDLAGPLAEALVNPSPFHEMIEAGSRGDWLETRRATRNFVALGFISGREKNAVIEELMHETRALVRRDQEAIARVAEALLARQTLTGDDIKRIVEDGR